MTTTRQPTHAKVVGSNTTLATWAGAISRALAECRVDAGALFTEVGVDFALVNRPDKRIPVADMTRLWGLAVQRTGDPGFGLIVARHVNLTTFHALGVAAIASATVTDAATTISRFASMISDGIDMQVEIDEHEAGLVMHMRPGYPRFADACVEATFASIVMTARHIAPSLQLSRVTFEHACVESPARYESFFGCPVQFAAPQDGVYADSDILVAAPLPASSPALAQANAALCEAYLSERQRGDTGARVCALIGQGLQQGRALTLPEVASAMAMSERKLQRLLREEGVQYRDLLDDVRNQLAQQLLADHRHSIARVAEQLGFDSLSAFSRAVRRWSGKTPRALRQAQRS